jgi:hypothetical protein
MVMKKISILLTAAVFSLVLLWSAGYADLGDRREDGKTQMKEAQILIDKGKMMQQATFEDKAAMVKEGKAIISEGNRMMQDGMIADSVAGSSNLQKMGTRMRDAGRLLVEKGEKEGPLTEEDKKEIKKQGEHLESVGKRYLEGGKLM